MNSIPPIPWRYVVPILIGGGLFIYFSGRAPDGVAPAEISSALIYTFNDDGVLNEAGSMNASSSAYWWLNSGGLLTIQNGVGRTVHGALPADDRWRKAYAKSNPTDTDDGIHPQNIFRLVTRSKWNNFSAHAYFMIDAYQNSDSPHRNESNGILLMSRYQDGDNLYYAGIRVDGMAVIKKKVSGVYYTLAEKPVFPGIYNHDTGTNLIPDHRWIGLKCDIVTMDNGSVKINLSLDDGWTGTWTLILEASDSGSLGPAITGKAYAGIRTDFMDVSFDDYEMQELQ
ncbi:MAG TPA: hypothetical protein VG866_01390 [Candidatus Paceibacterota bacterium]|nr:hypothetical protein [Candidatus Paceibacterota bacterium]